MKRVLFILSIITVVFCQSVKAQKTDTIMYYLDKTRLVTTKSKAEYFVVILPEDSITKLYTLYEYYISGKPKLKVRITDRNITNSYEGLYTSYYPDGQPKSVINFEKGKPCGSETEYFPDGKLYFIKINGQANESKPIKNESISASKISDNDINIKPFYNLYTGETKFVECRDINGNILAKNGNGKWEYFDWDKKAVIAEGEITDSLKEGNWHGFLDDKRKYECVFSKGKSISGIGYDRWGRQHSFKDYHVEACYKDGLSAFLDYLNRNIIISDEERANGINAKVLVAFEVDNKGKLSAVRAMMGPGTAINNAVVNAVSASPDWNPACEYGMPVSVQYILSYSLNSYNK